MAKTNKCAKKKLMCWSKKNKANKRYVACVCKKNKTKKPRCPSKQIRNKKGRCVKSARTKQAERKSRMLRQFKRKAKAYRKARGSNLE